MTLTTSKTQSSDSALPGENWFYYWKTSASLWESKLRSFSSPLIIVPLNWSFHSDTGDKYDFGLDRPETDLARLAHVAQSLGKKLIFFLPLTPAPFIPNGGIPHILARTLSITAEGMAYGICDGDGTIFRIYSFFDPRVYKSYSKFVSHINEHFRTHKLNNSVYGIECGQIENNQFNSFLEDRSCSFEDGFKNFLHIRREENHNLLDVLSPEVEEKLVDEYTDTIRNVYFSVASNGLSDYWDGELKVSFLGTSTKQFIKRIVDSDTSADYGQEIFQSICSDVLPSSVLIPEKLKTGILGRQLNQLVVKSYLFEKLLVDSSDSQVLFTPLRFFHIYRDMEKVYNPWNKLGFSKYLNEVFSWSYQQKDINEVISHAESLDENFSECNFISMFSGRDLDQASFSKMICFFLSGGKIVLDKDGLCDEVSKRLELFFLENSIEVEKIHSLTSIEHCSIGEGKFLIFDGAPLYELKESKLFSFWESITMLFQFSHLQFNFSEGIDSVWQTRQSTFSELNYEEVRRLSLYNPTSYKKRIKVPVHKNFALIKVVDQMNVEVESSTQYLSIELMPEGSLSLDFGVFS